MLKAGSKTCGYASTGYASTSIPERKHVKGGDSMSSEPVLDVDGALARLGGDRNLYSELAGYLLEDVPRLFNDVRSAVTAKDAAAVKMSAHALKGLVAGCGGTRAASVAQALENAGQAFDLSQAGRLVQPLRTELNLLTRALEEYRR
jgi:HPt (histidine-containing phosphotransfer) domain-containing protein